MSTRFYCKQNFQRKEVINKKYLIIGEQKFKYEIKSKFYVIKISNKIINR